MLASILKTLIWNNSLHKSNLPYMQSLLILLRNKTVVKFFRVYIRYVKFILQNMGKDKK